MLLKPLQTKKASPSNMIVKVSVTREDVLQVLPTMSLRRYTFEYNGSTWRTLVYVPDRLIGQYFWWPTHFDNLEKINDSIS